MNKIIEETGHLKLEEGDWASLSPETFNLFKEKDRKFPKEFVTCFLSDFIYYVKNSLRLILITFRYLLGGDYLCLECLRQLLRGCRITCFLGRSYEINDVSHFDPLRVRGQYWRHNCKQIPLFQILSLQELRDQYGTITNPIEHELFL